MKTNNLFNKGLATHQSYVSPTFSVHRVDIERGFAFSYGAEGLPGEDPDVNEGGDF